MLLSTITRRFIMNQNNYVELKSLPKPLTRWWLRTRLCKNGIQLGPEGMPACMEFYVPWWAWPLELTHRLIFGRAVIEEN